MKTIKLTQGKESIVDDEDYQELNKYKWFCDSNGYAVRAITIQSQNKKFGIKHKQKTILMHKVINNTPEGFETDHINGIKLDNRKSNLRIATSSQNKANVGLRTDNTSGYKGVCWNKKARKWVAQIMFNNEKIYIGYFAKKEQAATAYNTKALELFGEFVKLNVI
jgi:hypothetical protein